MTLSFTDLFKAPEVPCTLVVFDLLSQFVKLIALTLYIFLGLPICFFESFFGLNAFCFIAYFCLASKAESCLCS